MSRFTHFKHWHLFLVLIVFLLLFPFVLMIILSITQDENLGIILSRLFLTIPIVFFFSWLWSIGSNLERRLPEDSRINLLLFKLALFIPFIICTGISVFYGNYLLGFGMHDNPVVLDYLTPLVFISFLCVTCAMCFIAIMLNVVEKKEEAKLQNFIFDSILLMLWPIGLWIIQPRVNRIFSNEKKSISIEDNLLE